MTKKKKLAIGLGTALLLIVIIPVGIFVGLGLSNTAEKHYESVWGIDTPYLKANYSIDTFGWDGDGVKYEVFKLREEPAELKAYLREGKDSSMEQNVNTALATLQVPADKLPDWDSVYQWGMIDSLTENLYDDRADDVLYMLYVPSTMQLALVSVTKLNAPLPD